MASFGLQRISEKKLLMKNTIVSSDSDACDLLLYSWRHLSAKKAKISASFHDTDNSSEILNIFVPS